MIGRTISNSLGINRHIIIIVKLKIVATISPTKASINVVAVALKRFSQLFMK
jgi:ABC-type enterochelin transport system permease subunit